jgi:hypothetical protein
VEVARAKRQNTAGAKRSANDSANTFTINRRKIMKQIIIAQGGWVFVGDVFGQGDDIVLTNASIIRRWGTSKGLGQLAANGPQQTTILDPAGTVRFHAPSVIASIDCDQSKWLAQ